MPSFEASTVELAAAERVDPRASWIRRFILYWWVVPRVQYDFADLDYQLYTFDLFHLDWRTKLVHYVTVPAITFFTTAFFASFPLWPGAHPFLNGGLVFAVALALFHGRWCAKVQMRALWLFICGTLLAMWIAASIYMAWGRDPAGTWWCPTAPMADPLLWIYLFALVETASHLWEPIPPYITGVGRWLSVSDFLRRGGVWRTAVVLAGPTLFTMTSLVSNLHLFPTFLLRMMISAGFRRDLLERIERTVAAEWRTGQPRMHSVPPG